MVPTLCNPGCIDTISPPWTTLCAMADNAGIVHAAYIRTASTVVGGYEYLRTFPTVVDFYTVQRRKRQCSIPLVLLALIRATSVTLLIVSNYAFFYPHFTFESCSRFYLAAPIVKVLQIMVSQCIMGVRAYNLSGRLKRVGVFLLVLYTSVCVLQWISVLRDPRPAFDPHDVNSAGIKASCLLVALEHGIGPWVFYAVAIVFDSAVTIISGYYLVTYKRMVKATFLSKLMKAMIYDGLVYFVGLTATNVANLVFMRSSKTSVEVTAVSTAYVLVWILSQYIVLGQYRAQESHASSSHINISSQPPRRIAFSNPEAGPSGMTRATYGDITDTNGERSITELIELKSLDFLAMQDGSDPFGDVAQPRTGSSYPEPAVFVNPGQALNTNQGKGLERQPNEDASA